MPGRPTPPAERSGAAAVIAFIIFNAASFGLDADAGRRVLAGLPGCLAAAVRARLAELEDAPGGR